MLLRECPTLCAGDSTDKRERRSQRPKFLLDECFVGAFARPRQPPALVDEGFQWTQKLSMSLVPAVALARSTQCNVGPVGDPGGPADKGEGVANRTELRSDRRLSESELS